MRAGHIAINILYWTCTRFLRFFHINLYQVVRIIPSLSFRFNAGSQAKMSVGRRHFGQFFCTGHTIYPQEFLDFSLKIKVKIFGIFSHKPVLGSPDNTLTKFQVHQNTLSQAKKSKQLASSKAYFNKLLTSIFRQVRRWEQAILQSTYYTGCVHSILIQNFNINRCRPFGHFFRPYYTLRNFWIFR